MIFNQEQFEAHTIALLRKHQIATEELTETQLAEALRQALASGDFMRYVRFSDSAQVVVYIPFTQVERLRTEVARLKQLLEVNGIDFRDPDNSL